MNGCMWLTIALVLVNAIEARAHSGPMEYCAFEVRVISSRGEAVRGAIVVLTDESGNEFASATANDAGIAKICDAPPGFVALSVGGNLCGATSVRQLKRYWMETRKVTMLFDNCSGEGWVPLGGCPLVIRVQSSDGGPIFGAELRGVEEQPGGRSGTSVSDRWGRIFRFLKFGSPLSGSVEKTGYLPQRVRAECFHGAHDRDVVVTLEPTQKP